MNFSPKIHPVIDTSFRNFRKILKFTMEYRCKIHNFTKSLKSENYETQFRRFSDFLCLCSRGTLDQKKNLYGVIFFFLVIFFFIFFLKLAQKKIYIKKKNHFAARFFYPNFGIKRVYQKCPSFFFILFG